MANHSTSKNWNGIYSTWSKACEAARATGSGSDHGGNRWLQRIKQQLCDYRNEYNTFDVAMPPRPSNLPFLSAMVNPNSILDLGGSSGWTFEYLKNTLPRHGISSYEIVETPAVVDFMKKAELHNPPVKYKTMSDTLESCDILYCNSVLQYFGSNSLLVSLINQTTPKYIFLEDLVATKEDFYTAQTYYDSAIPYRFIGLKNLLNDLIAKGYNEVHRFPYASPILGMVKPFDMDNFPQEKQIRYSQSVLLQNMVQG